MAGVMGARAAAVVGWLGSAWGGAYLIEGLLQFGLRLGQGPVQGGAILAAGLGQVGSAAAAAAAEFGDGADEGSRLGDL